MQNEKVVMTLIFGLLALPLVGAVTSAQELPDPPGEPEVAACAFLAAQGILSTSCSTGTHTYSTFIQHGVAGSVYAGAPEPGTVTSRIQLPDPGSLSGWSTVHRVSCRTPAFAAMPSPLDCQESGELPEPGTQVRHLCTGNRMVNGLVTCTLTYLK